MADTELNAVLTQSMEIAPGLAIMRVVADGWELPDFTPGQFAVLGLPGSAPRCDQSDPDEEPVDPDALIRRAYSIASSSLAREHLEFYITLVQSGALTPRLFGLNLGDHLWLSPKVTGRFTLDQVPDDANVVLVSTGTGIAPYISMVRTLARPGDGRHIAIVHGARHSWDLGYSAELIMLERMNPNFSYLTVISRPQEEPSPWGGHTGYVQDLWTRGTLADAMGFQPTPADTHILLCGNPGMIESMEEIIQAEDFSEHSRRSPGTYHVEKYW